MTLSPEYTEVAIFGGCPDRPNNLESQNDLPQIGNTNVLRFEFQECPPASGGAPTKQWVLTSVADNTKLGTKERVQAKVEMIQTAKPLSGMADAWEECRTRVEERAREAYVESRDKKAAERTTKDGEGSKEVEGKAKGTMDVEGKTKGSKDVEGKAKGTKDVEGKAKGSKNVEGRAKGTKDVEGRVNEAEDRGKMCEEQAISAEEKLQKLEPHWVVDREEIQLTDQELGRGTWATVTVAKFRGTRVATKSIHGKYFSADNVQVFKLAMNLSARICHPNMLQFIGATVEGEMVILTELMPTSVKRELKKQPMTSQQTKGISMDVARALNYLHLMRPQPLIHLNISSTNVLLEPISGGLWKAKISDYGTVSLCQRLQTGSSGSNPAYAAPEMNRQSPKMDIFSFGILVIEMLTGILPMRGEHGSMLSSIRNQSLFPLVQKCLTEKRQDRISATDVITELSIFVN